jgi:putative transposase
MQLSISYLSAEEFLWKFLRKLFKPSQTCPHCGYQKKKELNERIHNCPCGLICDRDVAAAQVMLNYALGLGTSLTKRGSDGSTSIHCGGFKQLFDVKRPKPRPC